MSENSIIQAPQFFTQIPSYLKGHGLNSTDKYVYGTIYTMINITGTCYMSNKAIGDGIEVKPQTVSKSITKLTRLGFLETKLIYKENSKQVDKRYIKLGNKVSTIGTTPQYKNTRGIVQKSKGNRLLNRLNNNNKGSLKSYFSVWDEPNKLVQNNLLKLIEKHGQELFDYAVEKAAEVNATNSSSYKYIYSILNDWSKHGVTDVSKAKAYVEQRKAKRKPKKSNYDHKPFKEELPLWAKDEKDLTSEEKQQLADEKAKNKSKPNNKRKKELEDKLKRIRSQGAKTDE